MNKRMKYVAKIGQLDRIDQVGSAVLDASISAIGSIYNRTRLNVNREYT